MLGADNFPKDLRAEVRQYLRELPYEERLKKMNEARKSDDPLILKSILSAPHFLSGLPQDVWEASATTAVEAVYGALLKQLDMLQTAAR